MFGFFEGRACHRGNYRTFARSNIMAAILMLRRLHPSQYAQGRLYQKCIVENYLGITLAK